MKNVILVIIVFLVSNLSYAQFSKGLKQIGGSFTIAQDQSKNEYSPTSFTYDSEQKNRTIGITPNIGFFVEDNLSVGFGIGYLNVLNKYKYSSLSMDNYIINTTSNRLILDMYCRFHKPISDNFYLFIQPTLDVNFGKSKNENGQENNVVTFKENQFGFGIGATAGMVFMLNEKIGLETSFGYLGYRQTNSKPTDENIDATPKNKDQDFGLDFSFNTLQFGIKYYF